VSREGGREGGGKGKEINKTDTQSYTCFLSSSHSEYEAAMATKRAQLAELQKYKDNDPEKIDRLRKSRREGGREGGRAVF
jgi:hypothetical protein